MNWFTWGWLTSTPGGMFFCMFVCTGMPWLVMAPELLRHTLIRWGMLQQWECNPRICVLREILEGAGLITEPITSTRTCHACKKRTDMTIECDLLRKKELQHHELHFRGIITCCTSCGKILHQKTGPAKIPVLEAIVREVFMRSET